MEVVRAAARSNRPGFTQIFPNLLVGEYPTLGDVPWLKEDLAVTAVLSLQDESDLLSKAIDVGQLAVCYRDANIVFERIGISDCDIEDLRARLPITIERLATMLTASHRVYLHCNAGMNRAPTIAIGYLHRAVGMSLEGARLFLKARRFCVPYMSAFDS